MAWALNGYPSACDTPTIELTGFVGRIVGDWRVLSVLLSP